METKTWQKILLDNHDIHFILEGKLQTMQKWSTKSPYRCPYRSRENHIHTHKPIPSIYTYGAGIPQ